MSTKKAWIIVLAISMMVLPLPALAAPNVQAGDPTIHVLPISIHPGGHVRVSGHNFAAGSTYYVHLLKDEIPTLPFNEWIPVVADSNGQFRTTLPLSPTLEPGGEYLVAATTHPMIEPPVQACAPLTMLSAVTLSLNPTSGPPGTVIQFTAGNLTPGSLRLDYAGVPVLGPLPVSGTSYSGSFVVPGDRPVPLGSMTTVKVIDLVSGSVVGTAEANYQSQAGPAPPTYALTNVVIPTEPVKVGGAFTISGQVTPAPGAAAGDYQVVALWTDGDGKAFPISAGPATVGANGQFLMQAHVPDLSTGDPRSASAGDQVTVVLLKNSGVDSYAGEIEPNVLPSEEDIVVLDGQTRQPIQNAHWRVWKQQPLVHSNLGAVIGDATNQLGEYVASAGCGGQTALGPECIDKLVKDGDGRFSGLTDTSGQATAHINPVDPISASAVDSFMTPEAQYGEAFAASAWGTAFARIQPASPQEPVCDPGGGWSIYWIEVDALKAGYGPKGDGEYGWPGDPQFYRDWFWLHLTGKLKNQNCQDIDKLEVLLWPFPPEFIPALDLTLKLSPGYPSGNDTLDGIPGVWPLYRGYYSFASIDASVLHDGLDVWFKAGPGQNSEIKDAEVFLDGESRGDFLLRPDGSFGKNIPYPTALTVGLHDLKIVITTWAGIKPTWHILFDVEEPPTWFKDPKLSNRRATGGPPWTFSADEALHTGEYVLDSGGETPQVGTLYNKMGAGGRVRHEKTAGAYSAKEFDGGIQSTVFSHTAPEAPLEGQGTNEIDFSYGPQVLFDSGYIPIFAMHWPVIPVILHITCGAGYWFNASLAYHGTIYLDPPRTDLTVIPGGNFGTTIWADGTLLLVVGHAKSALSFMLGLNMPVTFRDGQKIDSDVCFQYKMWLFTQWGLLCIPITGPCIFGNERTDTLFNSYTPKRPPCGPFPIAAMHADDLTPPPSLHPALATDGFGHTLALWPVAQDQLGLYTYDGLAWQEGPALDTGEGSTDAQIAFFAPEQAMAVWAESSLTEAQLETATMTETFRSYHLAYATWDGESWSESESLTPPTTGEGRVALAACPETKDGCPEGGKVTAVWVRDEAGDVAQRRFRLYSSTYLDGEWSIPQAVDPIAPADSTDLQPAVVYARMHSLIPTGLAPTVAWVRDTDGDIDTLDDRRINMKRLSSIITAQRADEDSSAPTQSLLPDRIFELSLAVDAGDYPLLAFSRIKEEIGLLDNRHNLYAARQVGLARAPYWRWEVEELQDSHGRTIYAEKPVLSLDDQGDATLTFRGLGFGPMQDGSHGTFPEDTVGMAAGVGELAQLEVVFDGMAHNPRYLTDDGAVNWQPAAVYDPASKSTIALAVQGEPPTSLQALREQQAFATVSRGIRAQAVAEGPVIFANVPRQPDFTMASLIPSELHPQPGEVISVSVQVRNDGVAWQDGGGNTLNVVATRDGGYGVGTQAGSGSLTALSAGQTQTITLELTDPTDGTDQPHVLVVTVNPTQTITELNGLNNSLSTTIGGLPAPSDVTAFAKKGSSMVFLQWTELEDPRIAGYRVYRAAGDGSPLPVGSTFVPGFVDLTAAMDHTYHYTVVSFTEDGIESESGNVVDVTLAYWRSYLPLVRRGF